MRRRILDACGEQCGPCGSQHTQCVDRKIPDRYRNRHYPTWPQRTQVARECLHRKCRDVGLGGIEKIGRQVDDVVIAAIADCRHRPGTGHCHPCVADPRRRRPKPVLQCAQEHRLRLEHMDMRRAQREDLRGAEASRCARQQHARVRDQQIRQRIQRRRRVANVQLTRLGQCGDPVAVAVQAEGAWRSRHTQHAGVVGYVGVHPFGEIVQQRVVATRGQYAGDHVCIRRVQRRVYRLEVVEFRPIVEQQQRLCAE